MKKKLAKTLANYRTYAAAARAINDTVHDALFEEICRTYFEETPTVVALERLERQTESVYRYANGGYEALAKAYDELSAMIPLTREEQIMESARWQWFHATWDLKNKELRELYERATA